MAHADARTPHCKPDPCISDKSSQCSTAQHHASLHLLPGFAPPSMRDRYQRPATHNQAVHTAPPYITTTHSPQCRKPAALRNRMTST
ncbi:hypothetical protein M3J07_010925 [Ascochyta lentis]